MRETAKLMLSPVGVLSLVLTAALAAAAAGPGIWLDVPFVRQPKEGCGAAAISMIMQYWVDHGALTRSPEADVQAIQQALHSDEVKGILATELESYFQRAGFRTFAFRGSWADLKQHLSQGRPLIVAIRAGGRERLHYAVVAGLDWEQNVILVNDPARRKLLKLRRSDFENAWKGTANWTLLALPQRVN